MASGMGEPFDPSTVVFTKPTPNPTIAYLQHFNESDHAKLEQSSLSDNPLDQPTSPTPSLFEEDGLRSVAESKIRYTVFANRPLRVIKLPDMKLLERGAVVQHLVKTRLENVVQQISAVEQRKYSNPTILATMDQYALREARNSAIDEWVEEVTKFALLSHTWEADEPNYENFYQESGRSKQGYKKLEKFCNTAREDYGAEFAWADTVCIDKSSSAELDESIRSMFTWYRNAHICIVYVGQTQSLLDLAADRWFTRGWTLQELLAPPRLKFYNKDWYPLTDFRNDKISDKDVGNLSGGTYSLQSRLLRKAISTATGIDIHHFLNFKPGFTSPPLPQRMRWVARRITTRAEDKSYCMMGIFGVSMVVAYGEGPERAFFRLFQAILEVGYARDWFLWRGKAVPSHIHPSRMIPSGPECYLSSDLQMDHQDAAGLGPLDEPLSLTNIGLPMRLVVVPACVAYSASYPRYYRPSDIRISCPLSDDVVTVTGIPINWKGGEAGTGLAATNIYALGIMNFYSEMDDIRTPKRLYSVLLRSTVGGGPAGFGQKQRKFLPKWERQETDKVLVFRCNEKFRRMALKDWSAEISKSKEWGKHNDGIGDHLMPNMQTLYL